MRKFVLMLTAAMLMLTTSVCAAKRSEKKLSVKPFSVINVVGSLEVVYEQGSTYEVSLVGDAAAFDRIRVGSNGSDLNISKYGKVIGNVAIDMLRRQRPTSISGDEAHTSWLLQQGSDNNTPESQLEWKEDEQWLRQRIEQLPPREMQVMRLRQTEHRTNEQIAAILGISKDSVATMLSSARRKLFNQIKERNRT